MDRPIITSLLDVDFYKLTMMQLAWKLHPKAWIKFAFKNRTKGVDLPKTIPAAVLRSQLEYVRRLRFTTEEILYLKGLGMFEEDFLVFLAGMRLPEIRVEPNGDTYRIEAEGFWPEVSLWETIVLSTVNQLYYRHLIARNMVGPLGYVGHLSEGARRLDAKIELLRSGLHQDAIVGQRIVEFGTRRRFDGDWQRTVTSCMAAELPELFAGTSNVLLAKDLGLKPIGTFAHEMYMAYAGIYHDDNHSIRRSHGKVLRDWYRYYGEPLSVALTDQYGSGFFFEDFSELQLMTWKGLRHDSGPWSRFYRKVMDAYQFFGIDSGKKVIVWSDGLDAETILEIDRSVGRNIGCVYGWGTSLTNDVGLKPLSLVMKVVESMGWPVVKLSDNPAKAVGPAGEIDRYKVIFGYDDNDYRYEECKY